MHNLQLEARYPEQTSCSNKADLHSVPFHFHPLLGDNPHLSFLCVADRLTLLAGAADEHTARHQDVGLKISLLHTTLIYIFFHINSECKEQVHQEQLISFK